MTSPKQISIFTEEQLTSSQEVFPASPTHSQESEKEKTMTATSGRKCLEQFERFNRVGSWARTFSALLIGTGDWYSMKCKLIWKLKGTRYNRLYFQLAPSTHPTDGIGFGLWPTPNCVQRDRSEIAIKHRDEGIPLYKRRDKAGTARQFSIVDYAIYKGLLPTPRVNDSKNATMPDSQLTRVDNLTKRFHHLKDGTTSQLNPQFVLEMMGFPPDWTELPFLSGEMKASRQPGTP